MKEKKQLNILLLDNNDSFTYNIISILNSIENVNTTIIETLSCKEEYLSEYDKIIISPGPGMPGDFPFLNKAITYCVKKNKPLLGICLGHQAICEYFGAELINFKRVIHGHKKLIKIDGNSKIYKGVPEKTEVGLYHSWAVDIKSITDKLKITGVSLENVLMSVEHSCKPIYGIQYHPESFLSKQGKQILKNFLDV